MKQTKMGALIGKTIKKLEMVDDDMLIFYPENGERIIYYAEGDCCSVCWFNDINGITNLLGHKVTEIIEKQMPEGREDEEHDYLQFYGYTIKTERGYCDIEFRNASNGYYGGGLERLYDDKGRDSLFYLYNKDTDSIIKEITSDFSK